MNKFLSIVLLLIFGSINAQELNCNVKVNFEKLGTTNQKIFKSLETSLSEFINKTNWTGEEYKTNEKISCSITINLDSYESEQFSGSILVQSSRTAFNSTYASPVFNFNDKNFNFNYVEFQNLTFNPTNFDSNLVSVISFYSYMIIGMDQDTFSKQGGNNSYNVAQNIVNLAQASGYKGWTQDDGNNSRYYLVNDILSPTFDSFRQALYMYHFQGMDLMSKDTKTAKEKIIAAINELKKINYVRPNSFLARVFFDAKSDELVSVFSAGPKIPITDLVESLNTISPLNSNKWDQIK